jgi:hypothetical protein
VYRVTMSIILLMNGRALHMMNTMTTASSILVIVRSRFAIVDERFALDLQSYSCTYLQTNLRSRTRGICPPFSGIDSLIPPFLKLTDIRDLQNGGILYSKNKMCRTRVYSRIALHYHRSVSIDIYRLPAD